VLTSIVNRRCDTFQKLPRKSFLGKISQRLFT